MEVTDQIILFIASTIAGFFINKFVEIPFKESKTKNRVNKKVVWIFITILLIVTCNFLVIKYGSVFNNSKKSSQFSLKQIEDGKNLRFKFCTDPLLYDIKLEKTSHRKQVLLIGDSHTPDALNFLKLAYPNHDYRMISEGGCPPMVKSDLFLIDSHSPEMKNNCYEMIEKINTTDLTGYEFIVINILFEWYKPENLIRYIESINKKTNAKNLFFRH